MSDILTFSKVIAGVMKWGAWGAKLDTKAMAQLIDQCVDAGVTSFDHADIYGGYTTEREFGAAFAECDIARENVQLITKCGICYPCDEMPSFNIKAYNTTDAYIKQQVDASLKNLRTEYLDLLLIHRPSPIMDYEQIARTIDALKLSGKVRQFGVSNFTPYQFDTLHSYTPLVANQIEISMLETSTFTDGTLDSCQKNSATPMAWSPLGGGQLFGLSKEFDFVTKRSRIKDVADEWGMTLDQLSYVFLNHHPAGIKAVTGSSKMERIQLALDAQDITITNDQWFQLWEAINGNRVA